MTAVAVVVLTVGVLAPVASAKTRHPEYEEPWQPRVEAIAHAVERISGVEFDHPLQLRFLTDAAFDRELGDGGGSPRAVERLDRTLGLLQPEDDLVALFGDTTGGLAEGVTTGTDIMIRGKEHDVFHDYVVAHELMHALRFQIDGPEGDVPFTTNPDDLDILVYRAISEGEAEWVARQWLAEQSPARRRAFARQEAAVRAEGPDLHVPPILQLEAQAPYRHGLELFERTEADGGTRGVKQLVKTELDDDVRLLDPFLGADDVRSGSTPPSAGPDERQIGPPQRFGALGTYWLLASRIDPVQALAAADAWSGDRYIVTRTDSQNCVRAKFHAKDAAGADVLAGALQAWAAAMGTATVERPTSRLQSQYMTVTACGEPATPPVDEQLYAADALVSLRNQIVTTGHDRDLTTAQMHCVFDEYVAEPRLLGALASPDAIADLIEEIRPAIRTTCGIPPPTDDDRRERSG